MCIHLVIETSLFITLAGSKMPIVIQDDIRKKPMQTEKADDNVTAVPPPRSGFVF